MLAPHTPLLHTATSPPVKETPARRRFVDALIGAFVGVAIVAIAGRPLSGQASSTPEAMLVAQRITEADALLTTTSSLVSANSVVTFEGGVYDDKHGERCGSCGDGCDGCDNQDCGFCGNACCRLRFTFTNTSIMTTEVAAQLKHAVLDRGGPDGYVPLIAAASTFFVPSPLHALPPSTRSPLNLSTASFPQPAILDPHALPPLLAHQVPTPLFAVNTSFSAATGPR